MMTATCIAIFIIPALYYFVEKLVHKKNKDVPGSSPVKPGNDTGGEA
jgi:hypothetical protein